MTPVAARPAVSVIPLRDGPDGLEVFVQHRQTTMDFAAGAVVFPGGRCDAQDAVVGAGLPGPLVAEHARRWADLDAQAADPRLLARTRIVTGLRELAEETGLEADPSDLYPWDNWVTPAAAPKRFDVAFFVLSVPTDALGQPRHTTTEAVRSQWEPAASVLADHAQGRTRLMTPTRVIVTELAALGEVQRVLDLRPMITGVRDDRAEGRPRPTQPSAGRCTGVSSDPLRYIDPDIGSTGGLSVDVPE